MIPSSSRPPSRQLDRSGPADDHDGLVALTPLPGTRSWIDALPPQLLSVLFFPYKQQSQFVSGAVVTRSQLIVRIATQNPHLFQRDVQKMVDAVLDEIVVALAQGERVELRGFGAFSAKLRGGRIGRNPKSGAKVQVAEKKVPVFRPSKEIQKRLNSGASIPESLERTSRRSR
jgi:integration host factor subunit beta